MTDEYIHGYSDQEQARLTTMQSLLNNEQLMAMDFSNVRRVLDVGAGLGQLTRAIARRLPSNSVVIGVEQSPTQLVEAHRQAIADNEVALVEFRRGSAYD